MADFIDTGLDQSIQRLYDVRAAHSEGKISSLRANFDRADEIRAFPNLSIYCAGSYARLEASDYSDIDLFFISTEDREYYKDGYHIPALQVMSRVVTIGYNLGFPKFSNDGQYLHVMHVTEILDNLGGSLDDYKNHFTARLLMLLESMPLYGIDHYDRVLQDIVNSYFRDYPGHEDKFRAIFLINDIIRFWKTLCLNYENKRNQRNVSDERKIKQKIRNLKLKFSRLMTCYASIAYLAALKVPVTQAQVLRMVSLTPSNRLRSVVEMVPGSKESVNNALMSYHWFLQLTELTEDALFQYFLDESQRTDAFARAEKFGDTIYGVIRAIDEENDIMRYLVI